MKNRIITEKCKTLRALARQTLKNNWQEAIVFTFVCQIILTLPGIIYDFMPSSFDGAGYIARAINVYGFLINGPITLALSKYFIDIFRQKELNAKASLSLGFNHYLQALLLYVRITIFTWLWSMLFIVPGIIAAISYSQAFKILADNPTKTPQRCMLESKFIMQGNKWKYAKLLISFAGWFLVALIPAFVCTSFIDSDPLTTALNYVAMGDYLAAAEAASYTSPIISLLELLLVFPIAYQNTAAIAFFDILVGKLVIHEVDEIKFEAEHTAPTEDVFAGVKDKKAEKEDEQQEENNDEVH